MQRWMLGCGLVASLALSAATAADEKSIVWAKSLDDALTQAKQGKKLVMIDFTADWCQFCKQLDANTYTNAKVIAEAHKNFVSLKLDTDTEAGSKSARKYGVSGLPTIVFLDGDGVVQGRVTGYKEAGPFLTAMETAFKGFTELPKLLDALKAKPSDGKIASQIVAIYAGQTKGEDAVKVLDEAVKAKADTKDLVQAHNAVGDLYQERGKFAEALKHFQQAADAGAGKDKLYAVSSMAACHFSTGKFKEALECAEKALKTEGVAEGDLKETHSLVATIKTELESAERADKLMGWCKDMDDATAKAKSANKLVMVDFYTDWCHFCKELDKHVYANETAAKAIGELAVSLKIDAESATGAPLAKKFAVTGYPTILFLDGDGKVAGKIGGFLPPEVFAKTVKKIAADHKALPGLLSDWKADKTKAATAVRLAEIYVGKDETANAEDVIADAEKAGVKAGALVGAYLAVVDSVLQSATQQTAPAAAKKAQKLLKNVVDNGTGADKAKATFMTGMTKLMTNDLKGAKAEFDAALKVEGLPEDVKKQAQQMSAQLEKAIAAGQGGDN